MPQSTTTSPPAVVTFARGARAHVPAVADAVARHVARSLGRHDAHHEPDAPVVEALTAALHEFLDLFDGMPHRDRGIGRRFRALGQSHAERHDSAASLHAALLHAGTTIPATLRDVGGPDVEQSDVLGLLSVAGLRYLTRLSTEISDGFTSVRRRRDLEQSRQRVADRLLSGRWASAEELGVTLPDAMVVLVAERRDGTAVEPSTAGAVGYALRRGRQLVVVVDADRHDDALAWLGGEAGLRMASGWPVEPRGVPSGLRWATRALSLARRGVIADAPVIDCALHRTQLWLHAEPRLRQTLCQDLLAPLLAETPNSREILSETLLHWLESRDSARAIADRLGVHPQTVRYRWKRINEIFGERLHDPEFVVQVTMLLKASVPLWKAGDQSDFERFRAEEAS